MASQQSNTQAAANAKAEKAKKWAAFRAQNYDGEGWGDDFDDNASPPPPPPAPVQDTSRSASPPAAFSGSLPPSVVASLSSAPSGSRASLPSQAASPRMSVDLTRGIVVSGSGARRAEGRDSPNRQSWVEQRTASPEPVSASAQEPQELPAASRAPKEPIPEEEESLPVPDKRFSRSPQLPDLARMSMFGEDFFKNSLLSEDAPPPMPSLPLEYSRSSAETGDARLQHLTGLGVLTSSTTSEAQQPPPQTTVDGPSPPAERSASPTLGDTKQDNSAAGQLEPSADVDIPQRHSASPAVSEGAKSPGSQSPSISVPGGVPDMVTSPPADSTSNTSNEPVDHATIRALSPAPLRSVSPAVPAASGNEGAQDAPADNTTPPGKDVPSSNTDESQPAPAERKSTMETTGSVPKESDLLREEIIQSLGPAGSTEAADGSHAQERRSTVDSGVRESSYLPSLYDDYWESTAEEKQVDVPDVPNLPSETAGEAAVAPLRPRSKSPAPLADHELRRRFSWEQGLEAAAPSPTSAQPQPSQAQAESPADTNRSPLVEAGSPKGEEGATGSLTKTDAEQGDADVPAPVPRPRKDTDDDAAPKRMSLAAEKEIMEATELPNDSMEDHPALRDSSESSHEEPPNDSAPKISPKKSARRSMKLLSFREIMALQTSQERTVKFEEARLQFADEDQGLQNWIITLKALPEHSGATQVFNANELPPPSSSGKGHQSQPSISGQQPYYQQYLNASTTNVNTQNRASVTGLGTSPAAAASAFKHGSNQAGVKSKELLFAAGKAGKGLLSKGKHKLRGSTTGDKNEESSPQVQHKPSDRRAPGASPPASPSSPASPGSAGSKLAARRSPNGVPPPLKPPFSGLVPGNPDLVSPVSEGNPRLSNEGDDVFAPRKEGRVTVPAGSPLAEGDQRGETAGGAHDIGVNGGVGDDGPDGWVVIPPQKSMEQAENGVPESSDQNQKAQGEGVSDASSGHLQEPSDGLRRPPSFPGLPLIRRSSTFDPSFGTKSQTTDDDAATVKDDDSDDGQSGVRISHEGQDGLPTITDVRTPEIGGEKGGDGDEASFEEQTLGNDFASTEGELLELVKRKSMLNAEPRADAPEETGRISTATEGESTPTVCIEEPPRERAETTESQPTTEQQHPPPALNRTLPDHMTANPIQRLPPGQWNLQESYLSEPLISPSRRRPSSSSSRAESYTELDKETGRKAGEGAGDSSDEESRRESQEVRKSMGQAEPRDVQGDGEVMMPPGARGRPFAAANSAPGGAPPNNPVQPGPPGPRAGQKYGATPPVSMQRYRGLFAPKHPPKHMYSQSGHHASQNLNPAENSSALPTNGQRSSSQPPSADDKGRRGSGLLNQLGDRLKVSAQNFQGAPGDRTSGSEAPSEGKQKRRSSFFLNLKNSASGDAGPNSAKSADSMAVNSPSTIEDRAPSPEPEEMKRSLFGKGRVATSKFMRASTGNVESEHGKSRFGGFGGFGGFKRDAEKPGTSASMASFPSRPTTGSAVPGAPAFPQHRGSAQTPPQSSGSFAPVPPYARGRSGTTGSMPAPASAPHGRSPLAQAVPEERGRKISGPGAFLMNMWHNRSPSRSRERKERLSGSAGPVSGQPQHGSLGGGIPLGGQAPPGQAPGQGRPVLFDRQQGRNPLHQRRTSAPSPAGSPQGAGPRTPTHQRQVSVPESSPLSKRSETLESATPTPTQQESQPRQGPAEQGAVFTAPAQPEAPSGQAPTEQRAMSVTPTQPGPEIGQLPPEQPTVSAVEENQVPPSPSQVKEGEEQGRQMQDWRPVPVPQGAEPGAESQAENTAGTESPALVEGCSEEGNGEVKAGLVVKVDAPAQPDAPEIKPVPEDDGGAPLDPPVKNDVEGNESAVQGTNNQAGALDSEMAPKQERQPLADQPRDEPEDATTPSISEPSKISSPTVTPSSTSPAPRPQTPPARQPTKTPQPHAPTSSNDSVNSATEAGPSSTESIRSTPSRFQVRRRSSDDARTPQPSSPTVSARGPAASDAVVSSPTMSRDSMGGTVSPATSTAVTRGGPAGQVRGRAQTQGVGQRVPQGQMPPGQIPQGVAPGQAPGQMVPGQLPYAQPLQPGAPSQWRPSFSNGPVPGQQMPPGPMPPGFQGPPVPWGPSRASTQVSSASGSQHSNSPVQFQPMQTPPQASQGQGQTQRAEQGSGMSKWFKGIASVQQQQGQTQTPQQGQSGQGKVEKAEKSAKAFLSAFKRSSKQAAKSKEAQPQAAQTTQPQTNQTQGQTQPQFAPAQGQQPGFVPAGYPQAYPHPQYMMHPQWGIVPVGYNPQTGQFGPILPPGQVLQPGQAPQPGQVLQPGQVPPQFVQAPFPPGFRPVPGQMPYAPAQAGQFVPYRPGPGQPVAPPGVPAVAGQQVNGGSPSSASPAAQTPSTAGQSSPAQSMGPAPKPTVATAQSPVPRTPAQRTPALPQVNANRGSSASVDTNKPLPVPRLEDPEPRPSDVSQVSKMSNTPPAQPPTTEASKTVAALEQAARATDIDQPDHSLEVSQETVLKQPSHNRNISQASLGPEDALGPRKLRVDTQAARRGSAETNLYDATPRKVPGGTPSSGVHSPRSPLASNGVRSVKSPVSPRQVVVPTREDTDGSVPTQTTEPSTPQTEPPTQLTEPPTQTTDVTTQSTEPSSQGTKTPEQPPVVSKQQEIIRKMRLEAQEEKILVPGQEGLPGADEPDTDEPKMSATSYPGQEWNPYGGYEFYYRDD